MQIRGIVQRAELEENPPAAIGSRWSSGARESAPTSRGGSWCPYELLLQDPSLDPDQVRGHGFQAEIEQDDNGRWIVEEIGFATGECCVRQTIERSELTPASVRRSSAGKDPGSDRRRREARTARRCAGGRRLPGASPPRGFRAAPQGSRPRPGACVSATSRPVSRSVIRSVLPPMPETTQGSPVAMASRSELLIPSATLGRTKTSAARR